MSDKSQDGVTVVLVHGAWADASSWRAVIARLQAKGVNVLAVQNPTSSLADDVEAVRRVLARVEGPVVLVGHSWGGTVITEAGADAKVKALVYIAAFAPDVGQSTGDQVAAHPAPPGLAEVSQDSFGQYWMSAKGWTECVAQDLPQEDALVLWASQPPLGGQTFSDKVSKAAWKDRPVWYVLCSEDRAVSTALQRQLVERLNARATEIASSHLPLLSHPDAVVEVLLDAVAAVAAG
ncbi:alpha/beta fold hydrolase [Xaviernesmea oryzae]|uniref:alpha/beta fold hydrolase n=1 Tax=Xaviernesmea oryzae TaxID=464029 RepID=UPI0008C48956|nr:alpha/beta hydrolase [Xaviernesmea oryzae]SEM20246.1 Pimeloyl-ACP methyl ester carboxylesterase [Xaviernesmea oryzae]